jgi:hypothetical protein
MSETFPLDRQPGSLRKAKTFDDDHLLKTRNQFTNHLPRHPRNVQRKIKLHSSDLKIE